MNVNITLPTTMTRVAWPRRAPAAVGWVLWDMCDLPGAMRAKRERALRRTKRRRVCPFNPAGTPCPGVPTRLADGLGLEGAPVRDRTCAPEPAGADSLGPPLPRRAARD